MRSLRAALSFAFSLVSSIMLALAFGALWMLPTAYLQMRLPWLAWPVGALLGWAVARWSAPRTGAPVMAALVTLIAAAYVSVLTVTAALAGNMDMGLVETMQVAGGGMLASLTWLALTPGQMAWFASGALISAWIARRFRLR